MAEKYSKQEAGHQQCFGRLKMAEPLETTSRICSPLHCYTKTEILNFAVVENG
jgi:hypothetical protein